MSYSAGGFGAANLSLVGRNLSFMSVIAPPRARCSVGFPSRAGLTIPGIIDEKSMRSRTPWGDKAGSSGYWQGYGFDPTYGGWNQRLNYPGTSACRGASNVCAYGDCTGPSSSLTDASYVLFKDVNSLLFWVERRVRSLLAGLLVPRDGFPNTLAGYAYDASFCYTVKLDWRFLYSVKKALEAMNRDYPSSRWGKQSGYFKRDCGDCIRSMSRYYVKPPSSEHLDVPWKPCYRKALLDAPHTCPGGGYSHIKTRYIPPAYALAIDGDRLVPSAWFGGLLGCLLGHPWYAPKLQLSTAASKFVMMKLKK